MLPLVSVIIPTFNRQNLILRAVKSILAQSYENIEIIVVDDGSTDNTKAILEEYIDTDIIKYVYQENARQAAARNNGIRNSNGDYIAFLDSDDVWLPSKLEKQLALMIADPELAMVYSNQIMENVSGENEVIYDKELLGEGDIFSDLLLRVFYCSTQTILVQRSVIDEVGGFDEDFKNALEDWEFTLRIAWERKIGVIREPMVKRYENISYNRSYTLIRIENHRSILNKIFEIFDVEPSLKNTTWKKAWFTWADQCLISGYYWKAFRFSLSAIYSKHRKAPLLCVLCLLGPIGRHIRKTLSK